MAFIANLVQLFRRFLHSMSGGIPRAMTFDDIFLCLFALIAHAAASLLLLPVFRLIPWQRGYASTAIKGEKLCQSFSNEAVIFLLPPLLSSFSPAIAVVPVLLLRLWLYCKSLQVHQRSLLRVVLVSLARL